jgi:hypothetical protein
MKVKTIGTGKNAFIVNQSDYDNGFPDNKFLRDSVKKAESKKKEPVKKAESK